MKGYDRVDFENYLKSMATELFLKDKEGRYIFVNKPEAGWIKPGTDVIGKLDSEIQADPAMAAACREGDLKVLQTGRRVRTVSRTINNGREVYYEVIKSPVRAESGEIIGITGVAVDITEQVNLKNKLLSYYRTDVLTGLYNRQYLEKWRENNNMELPLAILVLDCNNLKYFNDNHGHEMGDRLLQLVAQIILETLPHNCISFRVGGDEFAIFCNGTDENAAAELKETLRNALQAQILAGVRLSVSIGCACMTDCSQDLHDVYAEADNRMYEEKKRYHEERSGLFLQKRY